jgi:rhodanese-related sulfurtransferase/predicted metal-dependent enzyme (double-stranded beta helix superfamily)
VKRASGAPAASVVDRRHRAVRETVARASEIVSEAGVTRDALAAIQSQLVALAKRRELFPARHFPADRESRMGIYRLCEDAGAHIALYASAGLPGKRQTPHNHTTWAVIAGVRGNERNTLFDRTDDGSRPDQGTLQKTGEVTLGWRDGLALMLDDIHAIEVTGRGRSLHLHMYGRRLDDMAGRVFFEGAAGGAIRPGPARPEIRTPVVSVAEVKAMIAGGRELAFIDVREGGPYAEGHPLLAVSVALSALEERIDALVPRRNCRVVLYGGDEGFAEIAAAKMARWGYSNLSILAGGVRAWWDEGLELFTGTNVPSKAFGEHVEAVCGTPHVTARELEERMNSGAELIVLDSRPADEFRRMSIPGAIDCPGAELVYRIADLAPSSETLVVVNCAGRTRSIIGAQSLINAGIANPVVALENGTMGWTLAGLTLEKGKTRAAPTPSRKGLARARAAARRVGKRFGVRRIRNARLERMRAEADAHSLYVFDVRSPEEYVAGHLEGARSAPGGQLVQATDLYVGTRDARIVLVDNDGVRATMTASWLIQMGWRETFVLEGGIPRGRLAIGPERVAAFGLDGVEVDTIGPGALADALGRADIAVVDLADSRSYRDGHVPGAWFAIRSRLDACLDAIPGTPAVVLTSPDGVRARLAAAEIGGDASATVRVLEGGTRAWVGAGLPLEHDRERLSTPVDDEWLRPYDRKSGIEAAMLAYLDWETRLVSRVERDGDLHFRIAPREGPRAKP